MSVCALRPLTSGSWKRNAMPRGLPLGSVSGILGVPVEEEKRTMMGVEGAVKCGAELRSEAAEVGVKVPVRRWPLAWAIPLCQFSSSRMIYDAGQRTWTKAGMRACDSTKRIHQTIARLQDFAVSRKRHAEVLYYIDVCTGQAMYRKQILDILPPLNHCSLIGYIPVPNPSIVLPTTPLVSKHPFRSLSHSKSHEIRTLSRSLRYMPIAKYVDHSSNHDTAQIKRTTADSLAYFAPWLTGAYLHDACHAFDKC